jgi:hypothetical protein
MFPDPSNNFNNNSMAFSTSGFTTSGMHFSPLKSNLEDMVLATGQVREELDYFVDDAEAYGCLTEDTFLENCPVSHSAPTHTEALLTYYRQS